MQLVNEYDLSFRNGDSGPKYLFRGPNIDWGVLLLKPGETLGKHYHNHVEETFYFMKGIPVINVNDVEYHVKEGDAFRVEPGDTHDIINDTDESVKLVFIKYPYAPEDKVDC
ncbi:cupin domain-containing protein [Mahella australiensis]|uniref:Cupin 2 conserved barrel domain protein n=1 Tax=Mahella australiensis (strain DSM 15567 / CIP 107919 / 50-1 BON) TaxID=697281 RepID=F4A0V0_MAHA5|nr:cupin domain-containing protein [Mahella australiensis]AEE96996.1 Cupin 2 conserved barrel domain protein [Mahella australiensis 50-1 BON]